MSVQPEKQELTIEDLDINVVKTLDRYEVKAKDFLKLKNQFATKTKDNYIIKMILDSEARQLEVRGHLEEARKVYENLSTFIALEEKDNPLETLKNIQRLNLRQFSRMGNSKVRIKNCGEGGCNECKQMHGKIIDISTALKEMPLPNTSCSFDLYRNGHSFCRCTYEPIIERINIESKKIKQDYNSFKKYLVPASIIIFIIAIILYYMNLYS